MDEQSFEQLVDQAAAGLKDDQELYLDVKQELRSHLEEKAERFSREGHSEEESIALSMKSLGSPMDLAGDLLNANRGRMKLRSLLRLISGSLIVPVAIILALYVGYGRFVRIQQITSPLPTNLRLPELPLFDRSATSAEQERFLRHMVGDSENASKIRDYWQAHREDPDSHMYYAYYTLFLETKDEPSYVEAMRQGEKVEPKNALYNLLLASYYLKRGVLARTEKATESNETAKDDLLDRRAFELGIAELRKAAGKPYLQTYQMRILAKKLAQPHPVFTEDYMRLIVIYSAELFPHLARYRELARKATGSARILISEGRLAEAEAVMDTWKPLTILLNDSDNTMIYQLVVQAIGTIFTKEAGPIYLELGKQDKAREAKTVNKCLVRLNEEMKSMSAAARANNERTISRHSSMFVNIVLPVFGGVGPTIEELKPGRMHEHVIVEEGFAQVVMVLLALALLGTMLQWGVWFYRLRRAASIPILLLLPTGQIIRALLLGVVLPVTIYWVYSRILPISGREFSLEGGMLPRMVAELSVLSILILWIPVRVIRRYIRQRCADLDIELPDGKDEAITGWKARGTVFLTLVVGYISCFYLTEASPLLRTLAVVLALGVTILALVGAGKKRREHGLYYGTVARSLAPIYAFSVIFISTTLQPLLLYGEAYWLRKDMLYFGYMANQLEAEFSFTGIEAKAAQEHSKKLREAVVGDNAAQR